MRIGFAVLASLAVVAAMPAMASPDCSARPAASPPAVGWLSSPALSSDLPVASHELGAPTGVFASIGSPDQGVDQVLARLHAQACAPASAPAAAASGDRGYVPRTKWDNTPYRFSAGGNGKKFTAADFDAWMKAKGIHIATGVPKTAPAPAPATTDGTATPQK